MKSLTAADKLCLLLSGLIALGFGFFVVSSGHDDSHITFWQAHTLVEHGALWNYNGERIEQSSSLLHVLLTALLSLLPGFSVVLAGYLVNLLGALLACVLLFRAAGLLAPGWRGAAVLLLCGSIYFPYWAFAGMETTLAAACVVFLLLCLSDAQGASFHRLFCACLLLAAVRPEMPIVLAIMTLVWCCLLLLFRDFRKAGKLLLAASLAIALVTGLRLLYFDSPWPNPVGIKAAGAANQSLTSEVGEGLLYIQLLLENIFSRLLFYAGLLTLLAGIVLGMIDVFKTKNTPTLLLWCLFVGLYSFFVIFSGGDWMREGRFWVPLIAPFCLILVSLLFRIPVKGLGCLLFIGFVGLQAGYSQRFFPAYNFGIPLSHYRPLAEKHPQYSLFERHNREHLRDIFIIDSLNALVPEMLSLHTSDRPITLMSKQMGMVSFYAGKSWFGRVRIIDLGGLVENSVRDCPQASVFGYGRQGLGMDVARYFERLPFSQPACGLPEPDIVFDVYGWGNRDLPGLLEAHDYTLVAHQYGRYETNHGADITANQVLAVHPRWLAKGLNIEPRRLDFDSYQKDLFTR